MSEPPQPLLVPADLVGDPLVVLDADGNVRGANAAFLEAIGPNIDIHGRTLADLMLEGSAEVDQVLARIRANPKAAGGRLTPRGASDTSFECRGLPIGRRSFGGPTDWAIVLSDLSAQQAAARTRSWLAAIIDSSDDAIASKTLDGIVTSWNAGAERLFGWTAADIIGRPITTIIPPELHAQERDILRRLRCGERVEHFDTVRVRKDGSEVEISLTVSPIRDGSDKIVGASKVARDVTARKQLERALRAADQRKDEFLATLAHELRNPLAPIRSAAHLIGRTELAPAARSACGIIERQVAHLARLVDELLDVARISTGRITLRSEPLDVRDVVSMAVESCRPSIDRKHQALAVTIPEHPRIVLGDRARLAQVFGNILGNASKYSPEGGHLELALHEEGDQIVVTVSDDGIGIEPERLPDVFALFTQINRSYTDTEAGLGIGLALAQRLIGMHGGVVEAHSDGPGLGSRFTVRLPRAPSTVATPDRGAPALPPARARRVLVADDNQDAARSLAMLLEILGHETHVVFDGASALRAAEEFRPDVALLDIAMPALSGYEVARAIAASPWSRGMELVALTGWGQESDRQRAHEAGFHHYLVKPVSLESLVAVLEGAPSSIQPAHG